MHQGEANQKLQINIPHLNKFHEKHKDHKFGGSYTPLTWNWGPLPLDQWSCLFFSIYPDKLTKFVPENRIKRKRK